MVSTISPMQFPQFLHIELTEYAFFTKEKRTELNKIEISQKYV